MRPSALALSAALLAVPLAGQATPPALSPVAARRLDRIARAELRALGAPGMVIAVVKGDRIAYLKAHGVANAETGQPMAPDMLGSVASLTKLVTAATAVAMAAAGQVDLEAPIHRHLPGLPERLGRLTLAQLLSHTSGLSDSAHPGLAAGGDGSLAAVGLAYREAFLFEPGTQWSYSNAGYTLAGSVLEAAAGVPFPRAVNRILLTPLHLRHATFDPRLALTWPLAQGHDTRGPEPRVSRPYALGPSPAGGLGATAEDLARLCQVLLADGRLEGRQVLPRGLLAQLTRPRGHGGAFLGGTRDYGFGLFLRTHRGLRIAEHEGLLDGFGASLALAPDRGLAAVALCNGRFAAPVRTTQAALELAAGLEPAPVVEVRRPVPPEEARRLAGRYADGAGETLDLRVEEGQLVARDQDRAYPVRVREEGHLEILGHPALLPLPATPLERVPQDPSQPQVAVRLLWSLLWRVTP